MVISGINFGPNMGDDTIYSGTVAAATEGYLLGIPSIAISLASKNGAHFDTAAAVALELVERHRRHPLGGGLLNVNVPDVPRGEIRGYRVTRLGRRHKAEDMIKSKSPRGETVYWVGAAGAAADAGDGTDFRAIEERFVSITPLQIDLTNRDEMPPIAAWIERERKTAQLAAIGWRGRASPARGRMGTQDGRHSGIGMTSTRTRDRMIERLRADGIRDEVARRR